MVATFEYKIEDKNKVWGDYQRVRFDWKVPKEIEENVTPAVFEEYLGKKYFDDFKKCYNNEELISEIIGCDGYINDDIDFWKERHKDLYSKKIKELYPDVVLKDLKEVYKEKFGEYPVIIENDLSSTDKNEGK